jgi:hypothetical protein
MNNLSKFVLIPAIVVLLALLVFPANACYGPHITGTIDRTQVNLNETVTVTGKICPPANNLTIRVDFTRPDYSYVDQWVLTDNVTGEFSVTQKLDMAGYWNVFPIYGHFCDRLYANVTDPAADHLLRLSSTPPCFRTKLLRLRCRRRLCKYRWNRRGDWSKEQDPKHQFIEVFSSD